MLHLSACVYGSVANVGLPSVLQSSQLDFKESYLADLYSREADREGEAFVDCFPYVSSSVEVLYILAREIKTSRRTASNVFVKKRVGVVSVVFKDRHRKTLSEAADAVS